MNDTYVFLDSTRSVPQSVQHSIIRSYANQCDLNISFYGAEFRGYEHRHMQLNHYLVNSSIKNYLFYSLDQFFTDDGFDLHLISLGIKRDVCFYFAAESIDIKSNDDYLTIRQEAIICAINRLSPFKTSLVN